MRVSFMTDRHALAPAIIESATGESVSMPGAAENVAPMAFSIFGKTTQDGTPTLDAPVDMVNIGDSGSIIISTADDTLTISTSNGLPGIPVSSGGNYTDANGQRWICDEVNLARGVYIQRIHSVRLTSTSHSWATTSTAQRYAINNPKAAMMKGVAPMSTHFVGRTSVYSTAGNVANNAGTQLVFSTGSATLADWKTWLDANEVYLLYALATPVETALPDDMITAYQELQLGDTITNNVGAGMSISYIVDTKWYIQKLITEALPATTQTIESEVTEDV